MSTSSDIMTSGVAADGTQSPKNNSIKFLLVGLVCIGLSAILLFLGNEADPARPFLGWLLGTAFWLSMMIGMLFLLMIWWMFDSGWSVIWRRQVEHALSALPWLALILLPLMLISLVNSDSSLIAWVWMNPEAHVPGGHGSVSNDVLYVAKSSYLNVGFFIARYVAVFAVWIGLATAFRKWSFNMDKTGDHANVHRSRKLAAIGLFLCAFATTIAAIDWFKTLNFHWFSTMYGVWFFAASMRAGLSAIILMGFYMIKREDGLKGILKPPHFYLVGCLMLAFTIFWAYISFCQYFLIYNANIPEETFWYNMREMGADGLKNSWWWVSLGLIFCHFFFPFIYLLWYKNKFGARLKFIALWILAFHLLDLYWNIVPQKIHAANEAGYIVRSFGINPVDVLMFIGVGGIVIWSYLRSAEKTLPIPVRDPRINESLNCHE